MVTMTLAVPKELKKRMESFPEINWSEVARQAFRQRVDDLELFREFTRDSTLTEEDALRLGAEVSKRLTKRLFKQRG